GAACNAAPLFRDPFSQTGAWVPVPHRIAPRCDAPGTRGTRMTKPLLAIRSLRAAYGKIEALKGVDIDINAGEIVALIGANGAGKSTLMMTIFGRPRARSGRIEFDGRDITGVPTHEIARLPIAQSPQ